MARIHNKPQPTSPKPVATQPAKLTSVPTPSAPPVSGDDGDGSHDVFIPAPTQTTPSTPAKPSAPVKASGTLDFGANWSEASQGQLVAGGKLQLNYDMSRFPQLLTNSHDGFPAWGIKAYVMAQPSGVVQERELMDFSDGQGSTHGVPRTTPASFDIPAGTTGVQVWFKNWTGADEPQAAYDSNFGANYRFDVSQPG